MSQNHEFREAAEQVLLRIPGGSAIGLGTGRAATAFIHVLGEKVFAGFKVIAIPTSEASATLAKQLNIPLTTFTVTPELDFAIDGADEVDPHGQLIKGYGGALLREKIVAASAKKFFVMVGPEKKVHQLGERGKLPVEVVPFGLDMVRRRLEKLGCIPTLRTTDGKMFLTDNGNPILDCGISKLDDPARWEKQICDIPGVVDTGLFINMADAVFIQDGATVEVREYQRS